MVFGYLTRTVDLRALLHVDPYRNLGNYKTGERLRKLLSPKWIVQKAILSIHETRHPNEPWITQHAVKLCDALLRPHHRGFEWGSGNGSAWIAERCASLVSVEHHAEWYAKVSQQLQSKGVANIDYRFVAENDYLDVINEFPDEHFNFVIIDGLFRGQAWLRTIPKLAPDGFIVFDNVNWYIPSKSPTPHSRSEADGPASNEFVEVVEQTKNWKVIWTTNGINDTAIYFKPVRENLRAGT
jgi:predicted O-methyltransferase YrrM